MNKKNHAVCACNKLIQSGYKWLLILIVCSNMLTGSAQNVGIGVNNPANKLQIGSVGGSGFSGNDIAIGNGTQVMSLYQSATHSYWYTNTHFALMHINNSGGNLRVGSTIDNTAKLHVYGNYDYGNTVHAMRISGNNPFIDFSDAGGQVNYGFLRSRNNNTTGGFPIGLEIGVTPPVQGQPVRAITFSTNYGPRMTIADNGNVGIGTTNPTNALQIARSGEASLMVVNTLSGNNLSMTATANGVDIASGLGLGKLDIYGDVTFRGGGIKISSVQDYFQIATQSPSRLNFWFNNQIISYISTNGSYNTISDSTLKTNIVETKEAVLGKLKMLQLYQYRFLHENSDAKLSLGFMAQNVQREFPELVQEIESDGKKMLTVDASKYGVIAIKAIQEQQELIAALQQQNKQLTERLEKLERNALQ